MAANRGKAEIAAQVASKLQGTNADGQRALNAVLETITEELRNGSTVRLTGFGTFEVRSIKERQVRALRGPQAGQLIAVPGRKRPGFRAGSELVRAVGAS
jgi:DNA-binding protein HU-beta